MNESKIIQKYRNRISQLNGIYQIEPPKFIITETNISSLKNSKILSHRNYNSKKVNVQNLIPDTFPINDISLSPQKRNNISNSYLFKTLNNEKLSSSCKKYKRIYKFNKNNSSKVNNNSEKIGLKYINDYFKPEEAEKVFKNASNTFKNKTFRKRYHKFTIQENNKKNTANSNLCYYFPNLFNVPYNKISSPDKNLNLSKFFTKNLKDLKYNENIKNLSLIRKNNTRNKSIFNSSESKFNKEKYEPIFIEKVYTFDILKNLRFNFKNTVEKGKHKNFINSFYITRNIKFNNNIY